MKFYELSPEKRRKILQDQGIMLPEIATDTLHSVASLSENVVGSIAFPLGLVEKLQVNGQVYCVPMATEEPSVVAAANHASGLFNRAGGVTAFSKRSGIWGQIILEVDNSFNLEKFTATFASAIAAANHEFASLTAHGGGVRKITAKQNENLLYLLVLVDPAEAMGANKVNAILEFLAAKFAQEPGITASLFAILSNYPSQLTTAQVTLSYAAVGGQQVAEKIALLSKIAAADAYRAVTNNKGIMNGVDAVLTATGNDTRAIEAACGMQASITGKYQSLSRWQLVNGKLVGKLTLPLALGVVGGSINARQDVQQSYQLLGTNLTSAALAEITASIGLANNLAALLAIATTGIQKGHMKLQARNVAAILQANDEEKAKVVNVMIARQTYSVADAEKILKEVRSNASRN